MSTTPTLLAVDHDRCDQHPGILFAFRSERRSGCSCVPAQPLKPTPQPVSAVVGVVVVGQFVGEQLTAGRTVPVTRGHVDQLLEALIDLLDASGG